ncbi:MAG: DUF262 domain-containing protein [Nannocystaceae bacterium]
MRELPKLARRPEARAFTVEALLELVGDGRLRVPEFQRPQRWRSTHVLDLFDSVWRGFPIGDLLLSKGPAAASTLHFGPRQIDAPAMEDALYIVDGQQRVTALAGALLHPEGRPYGDIHAIWFDLESERFERLTRAEAPLHWIPLNVVGDSFRQLQWLNSWPLGPERPDLVQRALALGKALREYSVPAYIVDRASESALRLIFKRVNTAGVQMDEEEVFEALSGTGNQSLTTSCARLGEIGFGKLRKADLLDALKAVEGIDPRRRFRSAERDLDVDPAAVTRTEIAMRRSIAFLIGVAGIPHVQLLPYRLPLRLLARFFHCHPSPDPRTQELLSRWIWRGALSRSHADDGDVTVSRLQGMIGEDPYASLSALLSTVPVRVDAWPSALERWNGRKAATRLCALAMFHRGPRDLVTGERIGGDALLELFARQDAIGKVFVRLRSGRTPSGLLNAHHLLVAVAEHLSQVEGNLVQHLGGASADVLASHDLDAAAVGHLFTGDIDAFASARAARLDPWMQRFFRTRSAPDESDRPPIAAIVARVEATR